MIAGAVIRPVFFEIDGLFDRFLFADAFITLDEENGRQLVLITTYYEDVEFDFGEVEVALDGERLRHFEDVGRDEHEPMRAVIYPMGHIPIRATYELVVNYRGQRLTERLTPVPAPPERELALATLFKDDFEDIETCYRYYKEQGVERFYFFYNGRLARLPKALYSAPEIVHGEWNFRYWLGSASAKRHHAQALFLTMARYRFLPFSSYLMLVDLDEFLAVRGKPGMTVRDYLERVDERCMSARNYWSEARPPRRAARVRYEDLAHVWANPGHEGDQRMKTIYRGDFRGFCGVHQPKRPHQTHICDDLALHHLINGPHSRQHLMAKDARPTPLI